MCDTGGCALVRHSALPDGTPLRIDPMTQTPSNQQNPVLRFIKNLTVKNWIAIVGAIVALVFILQNQQRVRVELLFLNLNAPLWIALGVVLLIGWIIGRFSFRKR